MGGGRKEKRQCLEMRNGADVDCAHDGTGNPCSFFFLSRVWALAGVQ